MKKIILFVFISLGIINVRGQSVGINEDGSSPNSAAILDIKSTSKGVLIPRMTSSQKSSLTTVEGLLIYQTDGTEGFYYYDGSGWQYIGNQTANGDDLGDHTATQDLNLSGYEVQLNGGYISNDGDEEGIKVNDNGIVTVGTHSPSSNTRLSVSQTNTNALNYAITALASGAGTANTGLYGRSENGTGGNTGVYGEASSSGYAFGLHGYVTGSPSGSDESFGVYGNTVATGSNFYNAGLGGLATGAATSNIGVYSYAANATNNYSFYGEGGKIFNDGDMRIDGRVGINATPPSYTGFSVLQNTYITGESNHYGISLTNQVTGGSTNTGIYTKALNGSTLNTGISAEATGGSGSKAWGVHGNAISGAVDNIGVYGTTFSTTNTAFNAGVYGRASGTHSGSNYGLYSYAAGAKTNYGLYLELDNTNTPDNNYSIYSDVTGATNNYTFYGTGGKLYNNGDLEVTGSVTLAITTKTTNYTIASSDYTIIGNPSGSSITFDLPAAASNTGKIFVIKNISTTDAVVIDPNSSENLEGSSSNYTLSAGSSQNLNFITIQSNGTEWFIISKN
jgi:hypothetical protein